MFVMLMYFSVCVVPDPQKGANKHKNEADAKDEPSSKKSSTCIVL